jgi:signal transduction protein with GAF and PtsI domain
LELAENLPNPFALITRSGETLEANHAFHRLAEKANANARLAELFGSSVPQLVKQAVRDGHASDSLPLAVGTEPIIWYRLSLTAESNGETLAAVLTDVSEEMAWRRELLERAWDLAVLKDIGAVLSSTIETTELAERVYEQTSRVIPTENFFIALHDRDTGAISFPRYIEDGEWRTMNTRPFGNGLTEFILRTGKPLLFNRNVLDAARALGIEPVGRPSQAWIGVPMETDGQVFGVIGLQDYVEADIYDQHDLEFLSIIAGQAAAAIKNARLLASARAAYQDLSNAQAMLLESERIRGITETVGALNHEINNPLAAVVGNAQLLLRRGDELRPDALVKIESILDSARRIQHVTMKMSTLIQASSRPYPGETTILDVHRSVSQDEVEAVELFPAVRKPSSL